jgi:stage III sporulation protein SpoIIIAA
MSCCDYGCNQGKNCPARESIIDPKTCVRVNTYGKSNLKKDNFNMNTLDIFKFEYRLSRQQHGITQSFIRAVRSAMRPAAF